MLKDYLFQKRQILFSYSIIMVSFPSGRCLDDVADNRINSQGSQHDVCFLQYHTFTVMQFMNGEGVC